MPEGGRGGGGCHSTGDLRDQATVGEAAEAAATILTEAVVAEETEAVELNEGWQRTAAERNAPKSCEMKGRQQHAQTGGEAAATIRVWCDVRWRCTHVLPVKYAARL